LLANVSITETLRQHFLVKRKGSARTLSHFHTHFTSQSLQARIEADKLIGHAPASHGGESNALGYKQGGVQV
jgi:hypothetical protein